MREKELSWISLWASLLEEAVEACVRGTRETVQGFRSFTASIILARTSWESFSNELIQQRGLPSAVKQQHTRKKLDEISNALEPGVVQPREDELLLVSAIRNSIIHQDPMPLRQGDSPKDIVQRLKRLGIIGPAADDTPWERLVISPTVAAWCCRTVGDGIVKLEQLRGRQFRPPHLITEQVHRILLPLQRVRPT